MPESTPDEAEMRAVQRRQRFGFALAGLVSAGFTLLIVLMALFPQLLAAPLLPGRALSVGLCAAFLFSLLTVAVMGIYVRRRTAGGG